MGASGTEQEFRILNERLQKVRHSAQSGGYDRNYYEELIDIIQSIRDDISGRQTLQCEKDKMIVCLNRARSIAETYKACNSFDAKKDDRDANINEELVLDQFVTK